jgi:hypothetical protein
VPPPAPPDSVSASRVPDSRIPRGSLRSARRLCPWASFRAVSLSSYNEMTLAASGLTRGPAYGEAREAGPLLVDVSHPGSATRRCAWGFSGVATAWILRLGQFLNDHI